MKRTPLVDPSEYINFGSKLIYIVQMRNTGVPEIADPELALSDIAVDIGSREMFQFVHKHHQRKWVTIEDEDPIRSSIVDTLRGAGISWGNS